MTHGMDTATQNHGVIFWAQGDQTFNNYGDDFVELRQVSPERFAVCTEERFVPRSGEWNTAGRILDEGRMLVILGDHGSGRHTAALQLLEKRCGIGRVSELDPDWSRPRSNLMPQVRSDEGYVLDMSEATTEDCTEDFARQLRNFAQNKGVYLIVITTANTWTGPWTDGVNDLTIRLGSPAARQLVLNELRASGSGNSEMILGEPGFARVWASNPTAADAYRLADIIRNAGAQPDIDAVVGEYMDWRGEIDKDIPEGLGARSLWWACAFCDGGNRASILSMAEALRQRLGEDRGSAAILSDPPISRRLAEAGLEPEDELVRLRPMRHGFAAAVRRHLWEEFESQTRLLTDWIVDQAGRLPIEDAERVVDAAFELVVHFRDEELLRKLRDGLVSQRRALAVRAFTTGALHPRFGAHMRERLNAWVTQSSSPETIHLVAEICAGRFGQEMPDRALVRLRHAAQKSRSEDPMLAGAFTSLARHHPTTVVQTIQAWLAKPASKQAGVKAFLAMAATPEGAARLCGDESLRMDSAEGRNSLIEYFQTALADPECAKSADAVLFKWAEFAEDGLIDEEPAVDVVAATVAPRLKDNILERLISPDQPHLSDFMRRVVVRAINPAGDPA